MTPPRALARLVLAATALAAAALPASAITGGRPVDANDGLRESLVRIESSLGELCTGVLVREDIVLTAAHCVLDDVSYRVTALDYGFSPETVGILASALHPSFVAGVPPREQPGIDLALVKLDRPFGGDRRPLSYTQARRPAVGQPATIAGFGTTRFRSKSTARTLRMAEVAVMGEMSVGNRMVIVADPVLRGESEGAGACQGDSGGPLLAGAPGAFRLDGIVSWSSGSFSDTRGAACGGFTAVTPLAPHTRWIGSRIRDLDRATANPPAGGAYARGQ